MDRSAPTGQSVKYRLTNRRGSKDRVFMILRWFLPAGSAGGAQSMRAKRGETDAERSDQKRYQRRPPSMTRKERCMRSQRRGSSPAFKSWLSGQRLSPALKVGMASSARSSESRIAAFS